MDRDKIFYKLVNDENSNRVALQLDEVCILSVRFSARLLPILFFLIKSNMKTSILKGQLDSGNGRPDVVINGTEICFSGDQTDLCCKLTENQPDGYFSHCWVSEDYAERWLVFLVQRLICEISSKINPS